MKLPAPEGYEFQLSYEHRDFPVGDEKLGFAVIRLVDPSLAYFGEESVVAERKLFVDTLSEADMVKLVKDQAADMVRLFERENEIRAALQRNFG